MNLKGKILGNRYEILEQVGNRWYGNCIQSKMPYIK